MFDRIYWSCQILYVIQVLLNFSIFVVSLDVIDGICHVFQVMNLPFDVLEDVRALFNIENRSNQVHHILHLFLYFIELVTVVNIFPHREVHLLQRVKSLQDLLEVMRPIDLVHRVVQSLQIRYLFVNFSKLVSPLN